MVEIVPTAQFGYFLGWAISRETEGIQAMTNYSKVCVRTASSSDCQAMARLLRLLGFPASRDDLEERFDSLMRLGERLYVATLGTEVVGVVTAHLTPVLHRPTPVGRLTMLVVAEEMRGRGIGRALVETAERELVAAGCELIEVTSNEKLDTAHQFYERLGYERTSHRFGKRFRTE